MADQPIDIEAAKRLADDLSKKLSEATGDSAKLQELRAEVEALRGALGTPDAHHSWVADRLQTIEAMFERAAVELLADGIKAGAYLAEIGRILGVR